jgi:uncharacterized protein DUF1801
MGPASGSITTEDHLQAVPAATRPIVEAALRAVRAAAPDAEEVAYQSHRPNNPSTMWKLVHYRLPGFKTYVAGIGAFTNHATLFFYRGPELPDGDAVLEGGGKDMRHVTLRTASDAQTEAVKRLLSAAFEMARAETA